MKQGEPDHHDPDDMFADTRMTFGEHIEDLRTHLLRAIYGFVVGFLVSIYPLGPSVLHFIAAPVEDQLNKFNNHYNENKAKELRELMRKGDLDNLPPLRIKLDVSLDDLDRLRDHWGLPPKPIEKRPILENMLPGIESLLGALEMEHLVDWRKIDQTHFVQLSGKVANPLDYAEGLLKINQIIRPARLSTLAVQESLMVLFKVIMVTGLVIASPWVFYQIWAFIAAGLYPREKRLVNVYLPISLGLFLAGVFICEIFVIPKAIEAMLWFNEVLGFQPDLRLSEWLGFAILMPLVFGVSFQTPMAMYFMERIGLFSVETYKSKRRIAWFLLSIFACIIIPTMDAVTMLLLWVPLCILYELGIWLCLLSPRVPAEDWETSDSEEMIEV